MNTAERLSRYYDFDPDVAGVVEEAAEYQNQFSFNSLAYRYGVADGPKVAVTNYSPSRTVEVLEFKPRGDYDETSASIYHLPMANSISRSMIMRGMRLFGADNSRPLILVGNPAQPGKPYGSLKGDFLKHAWKNKDLFPANTGIIDYLASRRITDVTQLGYSYGADKAADFLHTCQLISDCQVEKAVLVEPASTVRRRLASLAIDFVRSNAELKNYIKQTDSPPYQEIRGKENVLGLVGYGLGLLRLTNLAIARTLADDGFFATVKHAQEINPGLKVAIGWGDQSEITNNQVMRDIVHRLLANFGSDRVQGMRLNGMHHAGGDDIDLHAAIMLQGLKQLS